MNHRPFTLGALLAAASLTVNPGARAQSDQPPPAERRERIEGLTEKARDLKAAGRIEEAMRLMREAEELEVGSQQARRAASELEKQRAELRTQLEALRVEGRERDAAEVKERLAQLERNRGRREGAREGGLRPPPPVRPPGMRPEFERRLHHFDMALENLHAAGLHGIADRLAGERERIAERLRDGPGPKAAGQEEIERLRAEVNELRRGLQGLKQRIEELHRGDERR